MQQLENEGLKTTKMYAHNYDNSFDRVSAG